MYTEAIDPQNHQEFVDIEEASAMVKNENTDLHILVVDDEPVILKHTVHVLKKLGYKNVDTSNEGYVALGKLISTNIPYNIIVCDLSMPGMDGIEFMQHTRDTDFNGGVIFLSGNEPRVLESVAELEKAQGLNVLGALQKPIDPDQIDSLLARFQPPREKRFAAPLESITEQELRDGIKGSENNKLLLAFQPKISIKTGNIDGLEALPRWQHAERGFLDPSAFIPLAEKIGLINRLSSKVYQAALDQTSELIFRDRIKTAVNFSITSFSDPAFSALIATAPEKKGISPANIILELAENQVQDNSFDCAEFMMRMRLQKFGLSIDHFGGSNSSMLQLKKIPFTEMKIDRAFVNGAANDSTSQAILEASINLAKTLGMEIVAVGVETKEDWDLVEKLGCDYAQGFYCSQPVYHDELESFVDSWTGPF